MPTSDKPGAPPTLDLPIDELESLLADAQGIQVSEAEIPVLDEEVIAPAESAASTAPAPVGMKDEKLTPRQLVELGQRLQQRVDTELEGLADIIRGVVKRCILEELRRELPPVAGRSAGHPVAPGPKKPDAP
jgi:hypothetical protein